MVTHNSYGYCQKIIQTVEIFDFVDVSKFQKQIFMFSFEPKNERNYFVNSALASKTGQIKKMKALIN